MKTILFHVQHDSAALQRLEDALTAARACSAHLNCLQVTQMEAFVAVAPADTYGGILSENEAIKSSTNKEVQLRVQVEAELRSGGVTWDYFQVTGDLKEHAITHAALSDLMIIGRESQDNDFTKPTLELLSDVLHRTRTPLLIPAASECSFVPTGSVVIAWDASYEACNAVKSSVNLLQLSCDVRVIQVGELEGEEIPATRLLEYLSRYGIKAELHVEKLNGVDNQAIARTLIDYAESFGPSYIVIGGRKRGFIRRSLFGGVTQTLLSRCPLPLLVAS